jgi:WD40 repeat protein
VEALRGRSLLERGEQGATITLQPVVLEYVTDQLVQAVSTEVERGQPALLLSQPLVQATAKDYVRRSQERLIALPLLERLRTSSDSAVVERRLLALLDAWRGREWNEQGYGPGNVVNLLRLLRGDLQGLDFSRLFIRQACLAGIEAQDVSLAGAHLSEAVLAEAFVYPISVALSGDGAFLVAGTTAGEVWLWRVADRTPLVVLQGHTGMVMCVALSGDGRLLASGSLDGTVKLWEVPIGRLLTTLEGHTGGVNCVALSGNGTLLASGSQDGRVRLWEAPSGRLGESVCSLWANQGRLLAMLEGHTGGVLSVALRTDGQLVVSGSLDGTIKLWEVSTERLLATLEGHSGAVWAVALSGDGQLLASGSEDGIVRLWEAPSSRPGESVCSLWANQGRLLATLQGHTGGVRGVALSRNGQLVVSSSLDRTIKLWEAPRSRPGESSVAVVAASLPAGNDRSLLPLSSSRLLADEGGEQGQLLATLEGHAGAAWGVALSEDGRLLASGSYDGTARLWEIESGRPLATLQGQASLIYGVALSGDGTLLASGSFDGTVRLWEIESGQLLATLERQAHQIFDVAISVNGRIVASGGEDGMVRLWEVTASDPSAGAGSQARLLATLQGHTGAVWGVALSADGRSVASGSDDGTVKFWEAAGDLLASGGPHWRLLATLEGHTGAVRDVALSRDGELLASGSLDGTVRLWETKTGRLLATLQGYTGGVLGVALSEDGRLLASGSYDGTVRLQDAPSGRLLAILQGHTSGVYDVALSGDGELVVSGSLDGTVKLWQARSGRLLATLEGHTAGVVGVALSREGRLVASGGQEGTVRLWEASSGAYLRTLRADRRYERLDITGLTGVTAAQRTALLTLGAVEHSP